LFLIPFKANQLIPAIAAFDLIGLFGVWRNFLRLDHAAHLGGLFLGYFLSQAMRDYSLRRKINQFEDNISQWFKK